MAASYIGCASPANGAEFPCQRTFAGPTHPVCISIPIEPDHEYPPGNKHYSHYSLVSDVRTSCRDDAAEDFMTRPFSCEVCHASAEDVLWLLGRI